MSELSDRAIGAAISGRRTFYKYISANDTGLTNAHQDGFYVGKKAVPIIFDEPGVKGSNKERQIRITWQDGTKTDSMAKYYGAGTRNEYRITKFGRGFEFLSPEYTGAFLVLVQRTADEYEGFVLSHDADVEEFQAAFDLSPTDSSLLLDAEKAKPDMRLQLAIDSFVSHSASSDFPSTAEMSMAARVITYSAKIGAKSEARTNPDKTILTWTDIEYRLFRAIETDRYGARVRAGFESMDAFIDLANAVLNKRKSRAGKGFEHHLSALFKENGLAFAEQCVTEGNKRPDFIFPSAEAYRDKAFPDDGLVFLGAKTTCKDRWRQIITEADRFQGRTKFLATLQQGVSPAQMDEMQAEGVVLVVPEQYHSAYPQRPLNYRERLWTFDRFIRHVKGTQHGQV